MRPYVVWRTKLLTGMLVALAILVFPLLAAAQQPGHVPRIAFLDLHIPADLVVTPRVSPYTLAISTWYPHDVSSVPTATRMEMRHGTDGQTTA